MIRTGREFPGERTFFFLLFPFPYFSKIRWTRKERKKESARGAEKARYSLPRKVPSSPESDSFCCELSMPPVWTIDFLSFHFGCRFQLHNPSVNRPPSRFVTPPSLPSFGSAGSASPQPNYPPTHRIYSPLPILGMQIPTLAANWVNMVSVMRFWLATWKPQPLKPYKKMWGKEALLYHPSSYFSHGLRAWNFQIAILVQLWSDDDRQSYLTLLFDHEY